MIHILHGNDEFSLEEALAELKAQVGPADLMEANITRAHVSALSPQHLLALCNTVPFMAEKRMVIVEGLLGLFERRRRPQEGDDTPPEDEAPSPWLSVADQLTDLPPTTDLVLVDSAPGAGNRMLRKMSGLGQVRSFPALKGDLLKRWMANRASVRDCTIDERAIDLLVQLVGSDLRTLSNEIEKLSLHARSGRVTPEDVHLLVAQAQELSVFVAVDALLEGRHSRALATIRRLIRGGTAVQYVLTMVARQVRLLLLAQELNRQGVKDDQIMDRLGLRQDWMLRRLKEQGRRHSQGALEALHRGLLDTDLAIKTGRIGDYALGEYLVEVFTLVSQAHRARSAGQPRTGV